MKEITITEEKLTLSVAKAVSNILVSYPKDEEGYEDFIIANTLLGGMIGSELNKVLFGEMENNQKDEDVKV